MSRLTFEFKPELCIYCHACETACRSWRNPKTGISFRKVIAQEKGQFPDVKVTYISTACIQCGNPKCPENCPVDAPVFEIEGKIQKCDMCCDMTPESMRFSCVRMCPTGALTIKEL